MLRGFYTATTGMMAQQRKQEVLSNNMTNALTPGYKQDQTALRAFPELLIQRMENQNFPVSNQSKVRTMTEIGAINTGVYVQETIPDFAQGTLQETEMTTDFALVQGETPDENGSIFFTVQNGDGEVRYTRNGNFTVDGEGNLTTNQGYYVLDAAGNTINTDGLEFELTPEGMLQLDGAQIPLGIAYSNDANQLIKNGNDLLELAEGADPLVDARATAGLQFNVQQGYLENSNVDTSQTMTAMMEAYRAFEANQKVVQAYDRSLDKAVNEIARLG
ncbi:flagellar basal-body rod protein FlgG [Gracilibacillus ureilyticus]|uniref:Flagellar basal-body rod protein FlgG n=1 Tax=Gracilibacillus ureilyticus TaxID=531814 RepID=A0A1H9UNB7_9BACI|nr:flagellar hook-basal body protein [Gracilibacillus ureilyticus]SES10771.1 flagellar basal-body rod protein FlgG [Gracilibacillus ureilyticus]